MRVACDRAAIYARGNIKRLFAAFAYRGSFSTRSAYPRVRWSSVSSRRDWSKKKLCYAIVAITRKFYLSTKYLVRQNTHATVSTSIDSWFSPINFLRRIFSIRKKCVRDAHARARGDEVNHWIALTIKSANKFFHAVIMILSFVFYWDLDESLSFTSYQSKRIYRDYSVYRRLYWKR